MWASAAGSSLGLKDRVWVVRSVAVVGPARHGFPEAPVGQPSILAGKTASGLGHSAPDDASFPSEEELLGLSFQSNCTSMGVDK